MKAELLYKSHDSTGEGVVWLPRSEKVLWVDIESGLLHEYSLTKDLYQCHRFPDMISAIIPVNSEEQEILLTMRDRIIRYDLQKKEYLTLMQFDFIGQGFRINDAKSSPEGRIWFGVMHTTNHNHTGCLYCLNPDLSVNKVLDNQCIPNGMVWNMAGDRMYYADSGRGCIEEYAYDRERGTVTFSRTAISIPPESGIPDGMAIDDAGLLWVAHWGGSGVYVRNPDSGALVDTIDVSVPNVASCTFGGRNKDLLFITTARSGLSDSDIEKYPLSGSLFYCKI
jgi:sugar lactone lactonase YvrE